MFLDTARRAVEPVKTDIERIRSQLGDVETVYTPSDMTLQQQLRNMADQAAKKAA